MNLLLEKIIQRMKEKGELSPQAFNKELSFVRFDKRDSERILAELQKNKLVKVDGFKKHRKILLIMRTRR